MKRALIILGLAAGTAFGEIVEPVKTPSTFSRNQAITLGFTNGVYSVVHRGKDDWSVGPYSTLKVKPGERFRFSAEAKRINPGSYFTTGAIIIYEDGHTDWMYGSERYEKCEAKSREIMVPPNAVSIRPRLVGVGEFDGEIVNLKLERMDPFDFPDYPECWRIENDKIAADVGRDGNLTVTDKRTGRTWEKSAGDYRSLKVRAVGVKTFKDKVELDLLAYEEILPYHVVYELDGAELRVTFAADNDSHLPEEGIAFPNPFAPRADDSLIVPASEGYRLPFGEKHKRMWNLNAYNASLAMPFFGVEDANGGGWMAILETPDDAFMHVFTSSEGMMLGVTSGWMPQHEKFGYTRRVRYVFLDKGGYVAMAKRYRKDAEKEGLVKTFREKVKERPNVDRLIGAPNVWYFGTWQEPKAPVVAEELRAAGITRFLWSNAEKTDAVREIAKMPDVLVSRYDCYRDVYRPEQIEQLGWDYRPATNEICRNTSAWPDDVIWDRPDDSNSWHKAWGALDKQGNKLYCATQCTKMQIKRERRNVDAELKERPYNTRFIDVTTACGWDECRNPKHPMTRTESHAAALELLGLLSRDYGLVVGSEQGMAAAVPVCDYYEGMMSPWYARMPHGRPGASRQQIFRGETNVTPEELAEVEKYTVGEKYRIPLFELVFHDCCCSHWYWFDYSNRPIKFWWRRDLLNALYGTMPMFIFDYRHWTEHKDEFVRSYNLTAPIARKTGYSEMIDHCVLTEDRSVQRSRFADGTVVTVNFGDKPFELPEGGTVEARGVKVRGP